MSDNKKILISVPENLLRELDHAVKEEGTNRSDFIRKSIRFYLIEKRKIEI
ncbi:MAG TPA: CopG family transcriptional regulator, partial [Clostridiales bacterium]|nr:CopG family transcriptional regulator [Clostridiales bacterium]